MHYIVHFFSLSLVFWFCLPTICIEDSPDLTSPPLPASNKQRTPSSSSRGNSSRTTTAMPISSLPPPQQQPPQQSSNPPPPSSAGYSPYHPEHTAYQQYLQNQNAGAGGYRS